MTSVELNENKEYRTKRNAGQRVEQGRWKEANRGYDVRYCGDIAVVAERHGQEGGVRTPKEPSFSPSSSEKKFTATSLRSRNEWLQNGTAWTKLKERKLAELKELEMRRR